MSNFITNNLTTTMNRWKEQLATCFYRSKKKGFVYFGHGVADNKTNSFIEHLHLDKNDLIQVIEFWKRSGISFLSMDEVIKKSENGFRNKKAWVHFTFDDGYRNNLYNLLPIMELYHIPFTIFATSGLIKNNGRMPGYIIRTAIFHSKNERILGGRFTLNISFNQAERENLAIKVMEYFKKLSYEQGKTFLDEVKELLSPSEWDMYNELYDNDQLLTVNELKKLSAHPLVTIGTHGDEHVILHSKQPQWVITNELGKPWNWMEKNLSIHPQVHAYPNGTKSDFTDESHAVSKNMGVKLSFTTVPQFVDSKCHQFEVPRFTLTPKAGWIIKRAFGKK